MNRIILRRWHHAHPPLPFWRLYWDSLPGAVISSRHQTIALTSEHLILVPPNTEVKTRLDREPVIHFGVHFITGPPFNQLRSRIFTFRSEPATVNFIAALAPNNREDRLLDHLGFITAVRGLIHLLLARIPIVDIPVRPLEERLARHLALVEAQIERSAISNADLARRLGMSVSTMLRYYRRELGVSPQGYLRGKRIERACMLLHDPSLSIEQVAAACGFYDRYYFTKVFKRIIGQSPAQFRSYGRIRM